MTTYAAPLDHQGKSSRQWYRIQEQTLDRGIQQIKNRTEIHTNLLTTVQWQNRRIPQVPQSHSSEQLETHVEWDNLVWKATAAYNFFPTESSAMALFFLMFGCEATVKHNLLQSENPK